MDSGTLNKVLEIGGQAGLLWVAIFYLTRTLKEAYEKRIAALEKAAERCEDDRSKLQIQIYDILRDSKTNK